MSSTHYKVSLLSDEWWLGLLISLVVIGLPLLITRKMSAENRKFAGKIIGAILLTTAIGLHVYLLAADRWFLKSSLPLQLCSMSGFLSGLVFFFPQILLFELLVYWGLPGAMHSLITPEMSQGYSVFLYWEYYVAHAGIILASIYLLSRQNLYVRKHSWWRIFLITQIVMVAIGIINYSMQANYMYLCQKPIAPNPFVIGDWPWYIIGLELAGILHFYIVYFILNKSGKVLA